MDFQDAFITYPKTIKSTHYCFKLNTDDYLDPKPIDNYLRGLGIQFKRTRQQHKTKLIGWHVYRIKADKPITSFDENIKFVEALFLIGTTRLTNSKSMVKVDIGTLPYQLAFRKFKLANGISLNNISFSEEAKIQQVFDQMYNF